MEGVLSTALASSERATLKVAIEEAQVMLRNDTDEAGDGTAHPQPQLLRRAIKVPRQAFRTLSAIRDPMGLCRCGSDR